MLGDLPQGVLKPLLRFVRTEFARGLAERGSLLLWRLNLFGFFH